MWIAVGLLIGFAALQQACSISRRNRRLAGILHERRVAIRQLEQQALLLQEELLASKTHLASTTSDVTRVSAAAQFLGEAAQQMSQQVERLVPFQPDAPQQTGERIRTVPAQLHGRPSVEIVGMALEEAVAGADRRGGMAQ